MRHLSTRPPRIATSTPTTSSSAARACADELIGKAHLHRDDCTSRSSAAMPTAGRDRGGRRVPGHADGARADAERDRRAPGLLERARGDAGRGRRGAARRRQRVRRHGRGLRARCSSASSPRRTSLPARGGGAHRSRSTGRAARRARLRPPDAQARTIRARRACSRSRASTASPGRTSAVLAPVARGRRGVRQAHHDQRDRRGRRRARRLRRAAAESCAASRSSRAAPAWSATSTRSSASPRCERSGKRGERAVSCRALTGAARTAAPTLPKAGPPALRGSARFTIA